MNRILSRALLAVVLALLVAGTLIPGAALAQTLVVAQGADAVNLDPHTTNDQPSARVRRQIYETLIVQGEDLVLRPGLATSWTQLDELTYEFKLREGVKFHNGEPFKASDVKFTFERLLDPDTRADAKFLLEVIDEVQVIDDYTVRIKTKAPFSPILAHLAHPVAAILNEKAVKEAGDAYGTRVAVGTGPFRFVSWVSQSHIILARFDDYWGEKAKVSQVVIRAIPEGTVRAIELETGNVDIAYDLEPVDRMRLEFDPNIKLFMTESLSANYIGFNVQKPPFDDVRVRQAINYAIDVEPLVDVIYSGQAVQAFGPLSAQVFGAHTDLESYPYDPQKARELLAEAGYPNGFRTSIWTNDNPLRIQIAEVVQQYLADVGIQADVEVVEWGTYLANTGAGLHDMFILGWVTVTADADYGLYSLFHSSQFGSAGNRTFYSNPRVDELLDFARSTSDQEARKAAYFEVQEILREEAPWVFLLFPLNVDGTRANIEGFTPHPAGHHFLGRVSKN
ncbi:MAG: glutathione ABC transporter substrate-binding protein [Limnochordales bacterium]|nr:glutathione ABC transporter substrate-binding protein [Limnochordales bacterium]